MNSAPSGPLETRHQKFVRLAEQRVNVILDKLRLLGQLSDRRNYEFTDEQISKIFKALDSELKATKSKFANGSNARRRFTL